MSARQTAQRTTAASGARRTLFNHTLGRRPATSSTSGTSTTLQVVGSEETTTDIIVRDEQGNYQLDQPAITPMPRDELREEREVENRLIETYRKHQQHIEPNELRVTLQTSLEAKVASLEEDKWMFEAEEVGPM